MSVMEAPYTIASLPRPLDADNGNIFASPVYSFRGLKKRKRHEVVVGVDGESLNIYNVRSSATTAASILKPNNYQVQSQSVAASYAIPPQSHLCCPPCSVYLRRNGDAPAERHTYAALKDARSQAKCRIVRFVERIGEGASFAAPVKSEVKLQNSPFALEALPPASEGAAPSTQLIVSYADGTVECITPDGTRIDWKYSGNESSKQQIEQATTVDFDTAKKGILKERQDLATAVSASISGSSLLFMRIARTKKDVALQIFKVRNASLQQAGSTVSGLDFLEAITLPEVANEASATTTWELHAATGQISQLSEGHLTIYDLTTLAPRVQSRLGQVTEPITSFTRTSSSSILAISAGIARLYESRFGSIQASVPLTPSSTTGQSKKRKRETGADVDAGVRIVSSFSDVGLVAAIDGTQLVSFQVSADARDTKRGRATGSSLIDAIGKASRTNIESSAAGGANWELWKANVDKLVGASDVDALEEFLVKDLSLVSTDTSDAQDDVFQLATESYDPSNVDRQKALYLLGKIFAKEEKTQTLRLEVRSPILIQWLALAGLLNAGYLSKALEQPVSAGDVARALETADESFELLHDLMELPVFFEIEEVVEALKILIESLDIPSTDISQLALPPPVGTDVDMEMDFGDADSNFEVETRAAEKELRQAVSALQNGLEVRSQSLRLIFARLRSFPQKKVKTTLRARLSQKELVFFIQVLRIELAEGGWTSRYIDVGNDEFANRIEASDKQTSSTSEQVKGPSDQAIRHIGQLLTCAIDAISTSGWLVGLSGNVDTTQEILDSVRAEVSASLEGCLEAKTLERLLAELEKYADDAEKAGLSVGPIEDLDAAALPLGGRVEQSKRNANGKEVKKTRLEIAREKDLRVGKYSIDRIRI
ncbi:hypothetical protein Q7P37_002148 [Cladosporium fusiforme]